MMLCALNLNCDAKIFKMNLPNNAKPLLKELISSLGIILQSRDTDILLLKLTNLNTNI